MKEDLENTLKDMRLFSPIDNEYVAIKVFFQDLPIPQRQEYKTGDGDLANGLAESMAMQEPFPYVIIRLLKWNTESPLSTRMSLTVRLLIGCYDNGLDVDGEADVVNVVQRIYERFTKNNILKPFYRVTKMEGLFQEEKSYAYFFGGIDMEIQVTEIQREEDIFT